MDSYRVEKKAAMNIALADKDAEIDPVPTEGGGRMPELCGSDNGPSVNLDTPANVTYRLFFFLDHLGQAPPFRIEDNTTWDTNLALAVYWGLRMIERDEALHGKSSNAKIFVLLTDGQAWSGEIARSL